MFRTYPKSIALQHDAEFVADMRYSETLADRQYDADDAAALRATEGEYTNAWSYAFERNDEHRGEMELHDAQGRT